MNGNLLVYGTVDIDQDLYVVGNLYLESDIKSKTEIKPIESPLNKKTFLVEQKYTPFFVA